MPPVIIGVAVGASAYAAGVAVFSAVAIGVAAAVGTVALQNSMKPDLPSAVNNNPMDNQQVSTQAAQNRKIIYGEAVVGAQLVGYRKLLEIGDDYHVMVLHIAGHPCESVEIYQIEGQDETELGDYVTSTFYLGDQIEADPLALENIDGWTENHIGKNQTYAVLKIKIESDKFPAGVNEIKFKVKGKRLYDPRLDSTQGGSGTHRKDDESTWEWSDNSQLAAIDYTRFHGYDVQPSRRFDWDFVALAANFCDALVDYTDENGDPQQEKRFTCNGVLNNGMRPADGLKNIMRSMGAKPYRIGGKIYIKPAMYTGPATTTLNVNLSDSQVQYRPHRPERERCNTVTCRFVDPNKKYQFTDAKAIQNSVALAADGKELKHDLSLAMVNSETMAMRLANHALQRSLGGFIVDYPLNGLHIELTPGSNVTLVDPETGINKEFIIESSKFSTTKNATLVTMIEDGPGSLPG